MSKIKVVIVILSFCFLLSSCVFLTENTLTQNINENSFLNRFPENQKTIIIIGLNGKRKDKIYLCNKESVEIINNKDCLPIYATNQHRVLMLNPGSYYLALQPKNHPIFSPTFSLGNSKTAAKYFAIIEARAGEIEYVGEINHQSLYSKMALYNKLVVSDGFKMLQDVFNQQDLGQLQKLFANQKWEIDFLVEKYPDLKKRFKKRLLKNYPEAI